jgi:ABC-type antimicrobial peptide transport system permease subunit
MHLKLKHVHALVLLTLMLVFTIFPNFSPKAGKAASSDFQLSIRDVLTGGYIDVNRIQEHVRFLTQNCSPRVTGYLGAYKAADYIYEKFREFGLESVQLQWYNITIPVDLGNSSIELYDDQGRKLYSAPVYPMWPNSVMPPSTPPGGVSGRIFYVREGEFNDYNGHNVTGSIVLMKFNSLDNWLKAFMLGAKAVVFIEPDDTTTAQSENKYLPIIPLDAIRVYIEKEHASRILSFLNSSSELSAKLTSNMKWEVKKVANVIGFSPGSSLRDQWIILFAHYDAWSVVPSFAEGATDAIGAASLLELARFLSAVSHERSVMFVALSGYGEGLAGARYFVDRLLIENDFPQVVPEPNSENRGLILSLGIDLSTESSALGMFFSGYFTQISGWRTEDTLLVTWHPAYYFGDRPGFVNMMKREWQDLYGKTWEVLGIQLYQIPYSSWIRDAPSTFLMDGEAFAIPSKDLYPNSYTFRTARAWFEHRFTPLDTYSRLNNWSNLKPQLEFIFSDVYHLLHVDLEKVSFPTSAIITAKHLLWGREVGQVVEYDPSRGYYKPVPNALVQVFVPGRYRKFWITSTDSEGFYEELGITGAHYAYPYVLNQSDGKIIMGPDFGKYAQYPHYLTFSPGRTTIGTREAPAPIVAFSCATIQLFEILVLRLAMAQLAVVGYAGSVGVVGTGGGYASMPSVSVSVLDKRNHVEVDFFGHVISERAAVIFVRPQEEVEIKFIMTAQATPEAVLINANDERPEGEGFKALAQGEIINLFLTPEVAASDFYYLNDARLRVTLEKNIFTGIEEYHTMAKSMLERAHQNFQDQRYSEWYSCVLSAWNLEKQSYEVIKSNMISTMETSVILFLILIPFAFLAEKLFFDFQKTFKRFTTIGIIFTLVLLSVGMFHPGFVIASNVYAVLLGMLIIVLSMPVVGLMGRDIKDILTAMRRKLTGEHVTSISFVGASLTIISLGVSYMRKRKLRVTLILFSIVLLTASVVMLTSVTWFKVAKPTLSLTGSASYTGLYVRDGSWNPLDPMLVVYLKQKFGEQRVLPRAWLYAPSTRVVGAEGGYAISGPGGNDKVWTYYGLSSAEGNITGWVDHLVEGKWFGRDDYAVCIIDIRLSESLKVGINDTLECEGQRLRVIGILNRTISSYVDLDQYPSGPLDLTSPGAERAFFVGYRTLYVPYKWVLDRGGSPYTVVVCIGDSRDVVSAGIELARETGLNIYVAQETGENVRIDLYSTTKGIEVSGYQATIIPLGIVALSVANIILGMIYERAKEIVIFSAIGFSPRDIFFTFLAEALAFAFIGSIIGYATAVPGISLIYGMNILPQGFYPNYASLFVFTSIGLIMLAVIVPSIYPLMKAAKAVTPSLERKWRIESKPVGDRWNVTTPFVIMDEIELEGLFAFLIEYFNTYREEVSGFLFATRSICEKETEIGGFPARVLSAELHIAPFPLGVNQIFDVQALFKGDRWSINFLITRNTGKYEDWISANRSFLDAVRRQILIWRSLNPDQRIKYSERYRANRGG